MEILNLICKIFLEDNKSRDFPDFEEAKDDPIFEARVGHPENKVGHLEPAVQDTSSRKNKQEAVHDKLNRHKKVN